MLLIAESRIADPGLLQSFVEGQKYLLFPKKTYLKNEFINHVSRNILIENFLFNSYKYNFLINFEMKSLTSITANFRIKRTRVLASV